MSDFSLVGFESVSVQEFLPILEKIKHDLNLVFETGNVSIENNLQTLEFQRTLEKSLPTYESKGTSTLNSTSDDGSQTGSFLSCQTETGDSYVQAPNTLTDRDIKVVDEAVENFRKVRNSSLKQSSFEEPISDQDKVIEDLLKELESEKANSIRIIKKKDQIIEEKDNLISDLNKKVMSSSMTTLIKEKEDRIEDMTNKLKKSSKNHEKNIQSMKEEIDLLRTKLDELHTEKSDFEEVLESKQSALNKMESRCRDLEEDIVRKDEVIEALEIESKELKSVEVQLNEKDAFISNLQGKVKLLETDEIESFQALSEKLKSKRIEIRQKEKLISKLETSCEELEERGRKLEVDKKSLTKQLNQITAEHGESESKLEENEKQIKILRKKLKETAKTNADNDEKEKYLKEIEAMKIAINGKTKEKDKLTGEYNELKKQKDVVEQNVKQLQALIDNRDTEIVELKKECERFKKDFTEIDEKMEKKQQAIEKMKVKIKETQNIPKCEQCRISERELYNLKLEDEQHQLKIENLNRTLDQKYHECELLKKDCYKHKDELENIKKLNFNDRYDSKGNQSSHQAPGLLTQVTNAITNRNKAEAPYPEWWTKHMGK